MLIFSFLLPFSQLLQANVGGTLFGQDAAAILMLPILLSRQSAIGRLGEAKTFFLLVGLWLLAQIVTDLIRHTPFDDLSRGWLKIIFFTLQFAVLWLFLTRSFSLFAAHIFGLGFALILHTRQLEPPYSDFPWKFGLGIGIVTLAAAIGGQLGLRPRAKGGIAAVLLGISGAIALYNGARSVFGMALLASAYVYLVGRLTARPQLARSITPAKFVGLMLAGLLFSQGLISTYGALAESGALGYEAKDKYEGQSAGDTNIILGGRTESRVSLVAIKDSPIIGHGSWARDIGYVRLLMHDLLMSGAKIETAEGKSDLIPTHSHFFGAWVEAGVMGAVFWGWVFVLSVQSLYYLFRMQRVPSPIVVVAAFAMMWDIPFSPFGAEVRFVRAAQIALLLYVQLLARRTAAGGGGGSFAPPAVGARPGPFPRAPERPVEA